MDWTALIKVAAVGLEMINNHIKDPKRRLDAILDWQTKMREMAKEITSEENKDKIDELELKFIDAIHNL